MWSDALFDDEFGVFGLDSNIGPDALWNSFESLESLISDETLLEALEETSLEELFDASPVTSSTTSTASPADSMDCSLPLRASSHSSFSTNNSKDCSLLGKQLSVLGKRRKLSQHPTSMNMMKKKKKKKNKCISLLASPSVPIVQQRSSRERDGNVRESNLRGKNETRLINRDSNNNSTLIVSSSISCTSSNTKCQITSNSSSVSASNSSPRSSYSRLSSNSTFTISTNRDHDYWSLN